MTASGVANLTLDVAELVEEACERAGLELRTGYQMRTARRSLNLLSMEWANRGLNLWTIDQEVQVLTPGTATYDLPLDTIDMIEQIVRVNTSGQNTDYNLERISVSTYAQIPNKAIAARPVQVYVQRTGGGADPITGAEAYSKFTLWPVPDQAYSVVYWRLRRLQNAGDSASNTMDVPFRFIPALVAGLAYHMALKSMRPESRANIPLLKQLYDEAFELAAGEDRDRSSVRFVPWTGTGY
jgi:hypothetical protein